MEVQPTDNANSSNQLSSQFDGIDADFIVREIAVRDQDGNVIRDEVGRIVVEVLDEPVLINEKHVQLGIN